MGTAAEVEVWGMSVTASTFIFQFQKGNRGGSKKKSVQLLAVLHEKLS